ncbi:MAG TPA: molybdopterin-dependent oxidoreductase, partial [Candidatus Poseidoniaceae archaeon]|nr:molybdopterin-dependent oxidoreductase [Candidatus Poseidoniaceae archaeon]
MKGHRAPADRKKSKQKAPKKSAAGLPAIVSTTKHSLKKMGVFKSLRTLSLVNQKEGFDCPGCAWPDPDHRTNFEFCENGAKAVADEAMNKKIGAKFFTKYSISDLSKKSDYWLNSQGRLITPMFKDVDSGNYEEISWENAFKLIGNELKSLNSPNEAIFYTSGRTSNEAAFLYQLFVRSYGTNNLPDCSNMCHESSGSGLTETIGIGKGTVTLEDFNKTSLVVVMGQNPGTNHPRMLSALESTKKNGGKIIHVNPLPEAGLVRFKHPQDYMRFSFKSTKLSDLHLPVKINGDVALMKGIGKYLLNKRNNGNYEFDESFITNKTNNFNEYIASLEKEKWGAITTGSGLSIEDIELAGEMFAEAKSIIICWAMGLTQHVNGVDNVKETVNLLLLGGHFGRPGAGVCPVRGHSN